MIRALQAASLELTGSGMFEVTKEQVRGISTRVFANAPSSMRDMWEISAGHGDKTYLVYEGEHYTYAEIHAHVRLLANALTHQLGVQPGDRVAIAMRNYPEWITAYWAIVSVGATVVGMNAWWTESEMEYGLADAEVTVLICDHERLARVLPNLEILRAERPLELVVVRRDGALPPDVHRWADLLEAADDAPVDPVAIDTDSDACIFYTSGTTGHPKGAQLTHRGCVHNIMNIAYWSSAVEAAGAALAEEEPDSAGTAEPKLPTSFLLAVPLFHVTGCNCVMHPITLAGGKIVMMHKWNAERALELIETEKITNITGVPTMAREILMSPEFNKRDTSSIVSMGGGGAPLQPDLVHKIDTKLEGAQPGVGYGMTEACGVITMNSAQLFVDNPATVGPILPTLEARIVDASGQEVPTGERGELWIKGAVVIHGYLNRPEATAESITDGWLHTGDVATIDEQGLISIVDRVKDMIIRGGENISCAEVEAALYEHPAVKECAVFGAPDERLGEIPVAAVVLVDDAETDVDSLQEFARRTLAAYKVPESIWFRDEELPRNANGKFLKRQLRDEYVG